MDNLDYSYKFTVCEILLGIPIDINDTKLINFLILLGKKFINNKKGQKQPIYFFEFIFFIKDKLDCMERMDINKEIKIPGWREKLYSII